MSKETLCKCTERCGARHTRQKQHRNKNQKTKNNLQEDASKFVLVEVYKDAAAPGKHKETAHYATWRDTGT
jgi:quinol monooxygenase YgiN